MCNMQSTTVEILIKFETQKKKSGKPQSTTVEILSKFETLVGKFRKGNLQQ